MTTLSVPITSELENFINEMVSSGKAANKAAVVRTALTKMAEDEAVAEVMEAMKDVEEGRYFEGDIKELAKKFI